MRSLQSIWLILIWLLLAPALVQAKTYSGTGVSEQLHTAKKLALSDLQQNMYVTVETLTEVTNASHQGNYYRMSSKISSSLKILGAQPSCSLIENLHHCQVSLDENDSKLYRNSIENKYRQIEQLWKSSQKVSGEPKLKALENALVLFENIKPLLKVYQLLAPNTPIKAFQITPVEVEDALFNLQQNPDSLAALAANIGSKYLGYERIFVRPFTQHNELAVTPFAQALQAEISGRVAATKDKSYAFYELVGHYQQTQTGVQVSAQLVNLTREGLSEIAAASSHHIEKRFIKHYQVTPIQPKFDQTLITDTLTSAGLTVKLRTNKGSRDLLFEQGETVRLQVKADRPVFYHLVGHSKNNETEISYLLDLSNETGNDKFVQEISASEVDKWQTIGEFIVRPPFGIESLQLIAYEDKSIGELPKVNFSGNYYLVPGRSNEVVQKTRGLVRKNRQSQPSKPESIPAVVVNNKAVEEKRDKAVKRDPQCSESVLQFTTRAISSASSQ